MEPPLDSKVAPSPSLIRFAKVIGFVLSLVTFAAVALTVFTLIRAGPAAFAEFGVKSLSATWPTALALLVLVVGPTVSVRLRTPPYVGVSLLAVWLLSLTIYLGMGASIWSLRLILAVVVWTMTPLVLLFTLRTVLFLRASLRPPVQLAVVSAAGLVLWWLTAPMAIAVSCALANSCP